MQAENRCNWAGPDQIYIDYHDTEWGVPEHNSRALFEKLMLEGFQAGLSWITILKNAKIFERPLQNSIPIFFVCGARLTSTTSFKSPGSSAMSGKSRPLCQMRKPGKALKTILALAISFGATWMENRSSTLGKTFHRCPPKHLCQDRFPRT